MKIVVGDNVVVIAGKDKGKIGVVQKIDPKNNTVVVEGVNIRTMHVKPTQSKPEGGIEKIEGPINVSNVQINIGDTKDAKKAVASKIKYEIVKNKNGRNDKKRISKKTGEEI